MRERERVRECERERERERERNKSFYSPDRIDCKIINEAAF